MRWTFSLGGAELRPDDGRRGRRLTRARAETDDARAAVHVDVVTALRRLEAARARQASAGPPSSRRARASASSATVSRPVLPASTTCCARPTAVLDAETQRASSALVDALVGDALLSRALGRTP